jgi:hypothetical protein
VHGAALLPGLLEPLAALLAPVSLGRLRLGNFPLAFRLCSVIKKWRQKEVV